MFKGGAGNNQNRRKAMSDKESENSFFFTWHGLNAVFFFGVCCGDADWLDGWPGIVLRVGSLIIWIGGAYKFNHDAAVAIKEREDMEERVRLYREEEAEKAADLDAALVSVDAARLANDRAFAANELNNNAETTRAMCSTHTAFIKATDALAAATAAYEKAVKR
jgi:hypothetical protein